MTVTADRVIQAYIALRDKRSVLKQAYESEDALLKEKMDKLEVWLLTKMDEVGSEQLKGSEGIAYVSSRDKASCADWGVFWQFLSEKGRLDLLEKRVAVKAVMEYHKEFGELPPGLNVSRERTVNIRRA